MKKQHSILNSREKKGIRKELEEQFGINTLPDKTFFCLNKKEVYIVNKEAFDINQKELHIVSSGLHFGTFTNNGFYLSLEGTLLLGPQATRNVIHVTTKERDEWLKGQDIEKKDVKKEITKTKNSFVLLKCNEDFLGSGKIKNNKIINSIEKNRQLKKVFPEKA